MIISTTFDIDEHWIYLLDITKKEPKCVITYTKCSDFIFIYSNTTL